MRKLITLAAVLILLGSQSAFSQVLFEENFNYNAGDTLITKGWAAHSGQGSNTIRVVSPGLTYNGYASSDIGLAAKLINTGEDINKAMTDSVVSGNVYASFLVKVDTARAGGDYFFHLGAYTMGTAFKARVFVKLAVNGKLAFGIAKGTTSATILPQYTDSIYSTGTTYLLVAKYVIVPGDNNDSVSLFVNPTLSGNEPAPLVSHSDATTADIPVGRVALRQGSSATGPYLTIDGIRVSTSWNSLSSTVPVELTSFTGSYNNNAVVLKWNTATEKNNSGFNVEKKNASGSWEQIGFVKGNGTVTKSSYYSFTDKNTNTTGKVYYRLKQVDFDGSFDYSSVVEVNVNKALNYSLAKNYPNPFNPSTKIKFAIPARQHVTLKVFNLLGNEVATLVNDVRDAGSYTVEFNAKNLSSGVYYCRIQAGSFTQTNKMILTK